MIDAVEFDHSSSGVSVVGGPSSVVSKLFKNWEDVFCSLSFPMPLTPADNGLRTTDGHLQGGPIVFLQNSSQKVDKRKPSRYIGRRVKA
jgi:hypothetical protein